jgi:hypothetical protein
MHTTRKLLATLALASSLGACASVPGPLAPLDHELARMTRQPDDPAKDAWKTADEMALVRAGDCEDFAAFSFAWLQAHGLHPRLAIGTRPGEGQHAWVEVEVDGQTWFADLDRVSDRRPAWRPLGPGAVQLLRTIKGGPAWPAGRADLADHQRS